MVGVDFKREDYSKLDGAKIVTPFFTFFVNSLRFYQQLMVKLLQLT